ncbi:capsule biosynthesis protein [Pseudogulbenkiania ferrooxidans]|uniref:capsule biosynthesis protein n=1 Tax=Pseudogulbenkiania ferrooxidans TaxID=549169 RepID=UPI00041B1AC8|nr:capsular biosynthesis protein [Pseudogulbenkiania ferrooxidans]
MLAAQSLLKHRRLLLLQGPMGGFFNQLADWLSAHGIESRKINFNGGDWLFHRRAGTIHYQGRMSALSRWLRSYIQRENIDALVCFGDCRRPHQVAALIAKELGIAFYAFEEGYLRPDYITLEEGGVNAFSQLAQNPERYLLHEPVQHERPQPTRPSFQRMALTAMAYYSSGWLLRKHFPYYRHHKDFSPFREFAYWMRAGWRKLLYRITENSLTRRIANQWQNQYFLVALQVFNDSQIRQHSSYEDIRDFIVEVIDSFAKHASSQHRLVFKHHPMDRGHRNYGEFIRHRAGEAGIASRVHYVHDAHLPTLLKRSRGVVTINSTVGLSAVYHGRPLIAMGRALYDISGLTFQHGLSRFWNEHYTVDSNLYNKLRSYMLKHTQLNGAFFGCSPWMSHAKLKPQSDRWHATLRFGQLTGLTLLVDGGAADLLEACLEWLAMIG